MQCDFFPVIGRFRPETKVPRGEGYYGILPPSVTYEITRLRWITVEAFV